MFLLILNTSRDASKKLTISANRIQGLSPDTFKANGSNSTYCVPISNNSSEQDRGHCSRSGDKCPNWFICNDTTAGTCVCGPGYYDNIRCDEKKMVSAVLNCFCVTSSNNELHAGYCFYNCERHINIDKLNDNTYHEISNKEDLNEDMCGRFSRTGISCGQCKNGTSPFVLSYNLSCVECPEGHKNWWKFAAVGFVPLTFFCFFIVFFNINVTSSRLHGIVLFSQALSTPALSRIILLAIQRDSFLLKLVRISKSFYSLWNLDIFRSILPDICLNVSTLEAFALEACIAVYPMILTCFSYCLIELYDRNVLCIVYIWRPFRLIFRLIRENWDIRTSVIDSFATFFLLSYVKILSISADLMIFTSVHKLNSKESHYRLYYAGNVKVFQNDHVPYAALSITLLIFFIAIPTVILILFPFQCFQKCLSYCHIRRHFLVAFVDSFQGCYKDGTDPGTYDLRWLSTYGLVLRFGMCATFILTLTSMYFVYAILLTVLTAIVLINFQPYKHLVSHYTTIDVSFLVLLSLFYVIIVGINATAFNGKYFLAGLAAISCIIYIIYMNSIALHWIYSKWKWGRMFLTRISTTIKSQSNTK